MSPKGLTIAAVSQPRQRAVPAPIRAPLTASQKAERHKEHVQNQEAEDDAVLEWWKSVEATAQQLGERFKKKPRHFMDRLLQGGAKMIKHQEKVNPFNAFKAFRAEEIREANGVAPNALALSAQYSDEYNSLSKEEKEKLAKDYKEVKAELSMVKRDTPRARAQDVANTVRNMTMLIQGLCHRVGIEGFFLIVRNNADFHMNPQWYFTSRELERYMPITVGKKWDIGTVGAKVEAFAVAGCDAMQLHRSAKQKCDFLKTEIRELINEGLRAITNRPTMAMQYTHYCEDIVVGLGVELVGWTAGEITNPSNLSSLVKVLSTLRQALSSGDARWVKLSREEREERRSKWEEDIEAGHVVAKSRETRSDKGKKRKRSTSDNNNDAGDEQPPQPIPTASTTNGPIIDEPSTEDESTQPTKRVRRAQNPSTRKAKDPSADKENAQPRRRTTKKGSKSSTRDDETTRTALARQTLRRITNKRGPENWFI